MPATVPIPKFAIVLAAKSCELQVRGTSRLYERRSKPYDLVAKSDDNGMSAVQCAKLLTCMSYVLVDRSLGDVQNFSDFPG